MIFCEGPTEKYYFDYFAEIIDKNKYTDIQVKTESAGGSARTVLNFANEFLEDDKNWKYATYAKYLVFDCDDPPDIQKVITDSQEAPEKYSLLVTNKLFETWLLMHFEDVEEPLGIHAIQNRLAEHLKRDYKKADPGCIRSIIQNGDFEKAIDHGRALGDRYREDGKSIFRDITEMNPYTNVYKLIEQFLIAISK